MILGPWRPRYGRKVVDPNDKDLVAKRRESGRERSRKYYAKIKAEYGITHPERPVKYSIGVRRDVQRLSNCQHGCSCAELTTASICGFCVLGMCE